MKFIITLSVVLISVSLPAAWQPKPRVYSLDLKRLQKAKGLVAAKDGALQSDLQNLLVLADKALEAGPFSVTQKERTPPSGDKHDYFSLAPYWWPDPQSKNGLPYIRRDGETNPESKRGTDAPLIAMMGETVETLSMAYFFTDNERYAERVALLLRTWFLHPETKMNPHFRYAQAVPGHNEGRGTGLIESRHFIKVVDSTGLLAGSRAWTEKDQQALVAWFREFVRWMQTSENGKDEANAKNNHGSWYAAQLACYALFIGDNGLARSTAEASKARIARQIEPDGKQPYELQRTRSLDYSFFNLIALMTLAEAGKKVGVDLYNYQTEDGRSIRRALEYLSPFVEPAKKWPYQQISGMERANTDLAFLLRRAAIAYQEPRYEEHLAKYLAETKTTQRWQLLWPQ